MENTAQWPFIKRLGFRFIFLYLVFNCLPFPFGPIPFTEQIAGHYIYLWSLITPWVGRNFLGYENVNTIFTYSGDTIHDYIRLGCMFVLSILLSLIWSVIDYKRSNYEKLDQWLRVYVRFFLAERMIVYGSIKVIKCQFPDLSLHRLMQPFGETSPMGLVWAFIGYTEPYNIFTGAAEMLGGILLVTPTLTTLGSLVCIGVLSNIVMLNFGYDVPVKISSSHYMMMAIFLLFPDLKRLANLFILNRSVQAVEFKPLFTKELFNSAARILRIVTIVFIVGQNLIYAYQRRLNEDLSLPPPLYGIWETNEFIADKEILPPLMTDKVRWRRIIFDKFNKCTIFLMDDTKLPFLHIANTDNSTVIFGESYTPKEVITLSFQQLETGQLVLEGPFRGQQIKVTLTRIDENKFTINSRGFNWTNPYPFNPY